jgi:hypothetical protein
MIELEGESAPDFTVRRRVSLLAPEARAAANPGWATGHDLSVRCRRMVQLVDRLR